MSQESPTKLKFVMWGSYCADVLQRRTPYRQAHLDYIKALHESGQLQSIGPTTDLSKVFAVYLAENEAIARQLIEGDPYWQNGIWTEYQVYQWQQVF